MASYDNTEYAPDHTVRSKCGQVRITFKPDWSPSMPWATYKSGTAGRHFASLPRALDFFTSKGYRFSA